MTLLEIVKALKDIALKQPNINYVGEGDIYSLNTLPNIDYGVFFITQSNHSKNENTTTYTLTLFFVDRVTADGSNKLAIQSNGITLLANIINIFQLKNDVEIDENIDYTTFLQRFADDCSGVFCTVNITTDNGIGLCGYE